jgi:hypothetical protein
MPTARFVADFSSFSQAVDRAQVELKGFEAGAAKVGTAINKMANSLSGTRLIQDATLMASAVEKIGGPSKLTAAELANVGAKAAEAVDKMKRIGVEVPPGLQKLADTTRGVEQRTDSLGVSFGKLVASYVTGQAIIGAVKGAFNSFVGVIESSITAAGDAEKAHVQLVAALRAQGTAVPSVVTAYTQYAEALQQTTVFQDDALEGAAALLVTIGNVMPRDMKRALEATTNLASGLGIDLAEAARVVAKAAEGNTTALRKVGVVMDDSKGKAHSFGEVLDAIGAKFGGQAAAIAGTYQGRLLQLGNTWNNVEESIGRVITQNATLLTAFDLINKAIAGNTKELNSNLQANELVSGSVLFVVRGLELGLTAVDLIQTAYQGLRITSNELVKAFLNIGIAVLDSATAFGKATIFLNPAALTGGFQEQMRQMSDWSTHLKGAVEGLNQDSLDAIDTSVKHGNAISDLHHQVTTFGEQLEKTRGQTVKLADATDTGTDAWNRHTTAVKQTDKELAAAQREIFAMTARWLEIQVVLNKAAQADIGAATAFIAKAIIGNDAAMRAAHREAADDMAKRMLTSLDLQIRGVEQWAHDQKVAVDTTASNWKAAFAEIDAAAAEKLQNIFAGESIASMVRAAKAAGAVTETGFLAGFTQVVDDIPRMIEQAFTGGGGGSGAAKAIASKFGAQLGDELAHSKFGEGLSDKLASVFGVKSAEGAGGIANLVTGGLKAGLAGLASLAVSGIGALFGKLFDNPEKQINPIRQAFVNAAGGLDVLNEKAHAAGVTLNAMLNAKNPEQYKKAIDDLNAAFDRHNKGLADAVGGTNALGLAFRKPFDDAQAQLDSLTQRFQTQGVDLAKLLLKTPSKDDAAAAKFGLDLASQVFEAMRKAGATEQDILGLQSQLELARTTLQPQFEHLGLYIAATFGAQIKEGASAFDAFMKLQPAFKALSDGIYKFGLQSTDTIDQLIRIERVVDANKDVFESIQAVTQVYDGLTAAGYTTRELFVAFGQDIAAQFKKLIDFGSDANEVMVLMQPELQRLWEGQEKFGLVTDEATQKLLKQAEEQGLVGPKMKSINEQILDVLTQIRDVLSGAKTATDEWGKSLTRLPKVIDVAVRFSGDTPPDFGNFAATGGLVTASGIQHFTRGGRVLPFRARGTDTVPAMLTPGEMVLTKAQQAAILGGSAVDLSELRAEIQQLRRQLDAQNRLLPKAIRDAILLAS